MKLPGPNTGHAFWKKEYNAIAAQGKPLKNIIDMLAQKNPEIQKACKLLNQHCSSVTPPSLIILLKKYNPTPDEIKEAVKILRKLRTKIISGISLDNRKKHSKMFRKIETR
jgi:hypothetical protein